MMNAGKVETSDKSLLRVKFVSFIFDVLRITAGSDSDDSGGVDSVTMSLISYHGDWNH